MVVDGSGGGGGELANGQVIRRCVEVRRYRKLPPEDPNWSAQKDQLYCGPVLYADSSLPFKIPLFHSFVYR